MFGNASLSGVVVGRWSRLLARLATLALTLALAHSLARLTWLWFPLPPFEEPPMLAGVQGERGSGAPPRGPTPENLMEAVAASHLFGMAQGPRPQTAAKAIDAPETRLNLVLRGVIVGDEKTQGWAFIAEPNGNEDRYEVDAYLSGRVQVSDILRDRVILRRGDRYETLFLEKEGSGGGLAAVAPQRISGGARKRSPGTRGPRAQ